MTEAPFGTLRSWRPSGAATRVACSNGHRLASFSELARTMTVRTVSGNGASNPLEDKQTHAVVARVTDSSGQLRSARRAGARRGGAGAVTAVNELRANACSPWQRQALRQGDGRERSDANASAPTDIRPCGSVTDVSWLSQNARIRWR